MTELGDQLTLREAQARYFELNGPGTDGGYAARWVKLRIGSLRFGFANTAARVRAVRLRDLHHLVTGYPTDWKGEFEISAWEITGSCRSYVAAWFVAWSGVAVCYGLAVLALHVSALTGVTWLAIGLLPG